jgi:hypothetical protein
VPKISVDRLSPVADYLFGGAVSGSKMAQKIGLSRSALCRYMRERGLEQSHALSLAAALDREATELREAARDLRAAIDG